MEFVRTAENDSFSILDMKREQVANLAGVLSGIVNFRFLDITPAILLLWRDQGYLPDEACEILNHSQDLVREIIIGLMEVAGVEEHKIESLFVQG